MKVYRIENPDSGKGPYMVKHEGLDMSLVKNIIKMHEIHNRYRELFPGFHSDFSLKDILKLKQCRTHKIETLFGFTSIEKLEEWFNVYIKDLLTSGLFVIKEYDCDDCNVIVSSSGKQCVFIINRERDGMGKTINFNVTEAMQLKYINMLTLMIKQYIWYEF